jgi:hypothetical protein
VLKDHYHYLMMDHLLFVPKYISSKLSVAVKAASLAALAALAALLAVFAKLLELLAKLLEFEA